MEKSESVELVSSIGNWIISLALNSCRRFTLEKQISNFSSQLAQTTIEFFWIFEISRLTHYVNSAFIISNNLKSELKVTIIRVSEIDLPRSAIRWEIF